MKIPNAEYKIPMMVNKIRELGVVALLHDKPESGLVQGQVGTVVETLEDSVFEVELCDDNGIAYAMLAINEDELIVLHCSQIEAT